MLAQVKKLVGGDLAGRFGAWWEGRDYVAPAPAGDEAETAAPAAPAPAAPAKPAPVAVVAPEAPDKDLFEDATAEAAELSRETALRLASSGSSARLRALETIWGEGRFAPGTRSLDSRLMEALGIGGKGDVGFIGVDGAILRSSALRLDGVARVAEWRPACVDRLRELAPGAAIEASEIDRPRGFVDGSLQGLISIEAFAYADYKAGLVARAFKSLADTGRWVFLDTTRTTTKTPPEAFASAWAEPLLSTGSEIRELLKLAGFQHVTCEPVTGMVLEAARVGYAQLSQVLQAATGGLDGREGALFLQELAWEAQSWRARCRALEGGALRVDIWTAYKVAPPGAVEDREPQPAIVETYAPVAERVPEPFVQPAEDLTEALVRPVKTATARSAIDPRDDLIRPVAADDGDLLFE